MTQDVSSQQNGASAFVSSLGINTKSGDYIDGYKNASLIINSLNYIGISTVRDAYSQYGQANEVIDALASAGVKFDFRVSYTLPASGSAGISSYIDALKAFVAEHPGSIIAIEGLNEVNTLTSLTYNGATYIDAAVAFQRDLYTAIKADPVLSSVVVYNLSLADNDATAYAAVGDLGAYSDAANAHPYPNTGRAVDGQVENTISLAQSTSRGDPVVVTETGYTTLPSVPGVGVDQDAQAKLILQNILSAYEDGSSQTYIYTLFDEPSVSDTRGEKEVTFGIFNADGSPKEAAIALHNLTTILNFGNDGSATTATDTQFTLSGAPSSTHSMVLTKSGDVYDIVLWQDTPVWNDVTDTAITTPATTTTVNLGEVASTVRVYDPLNGLEPIATYTNVSSFTVPLSDHPLIIEVGATEAVHETVVTSQPNLTLTAADFVAQMDTLAKADGIQSITLTDTHRLDVASVETMQYIIANYGNLLSKIDGGYTFDVTYEQSTWRRELIYDANGNEISHIQYALNNGVVTSKVVYDPSGTVTDIYTYNIVGQTYTTQHQKFNAAGTAVLTERFHADGTPDYVQTIAADGTKQTVTYDSTGHKMSDVTIGTGGASTSLTYDPASGKLTQSVVQGSDGVITTKNYTDGVLVRTVVQNTDGTSDYYNYNITGQTYTTQHQKLDASGKVVLIERFRADGTAESTQIFNVDGSKDTVTYNSAGQKVADINVAVDGTNTTLTYDGPTGSLIQSVAKSTSGVIITKNYTDGALMRTVVQNTDGTTDYYHYNITGQTYTNQHQKLDASGKVVLIERYHADGTRDSTQIYNTDGSKETITYNSAGQKISDATVAADGGTLTLTYDPASGILTTSVAKSAGGVITTKNYTSGVLMRTVVQNTDGTSDYYYYNITGEKYTSQHQKLDASGKAVLIERYHADGTRESTQIYSPDGSKETITYNNAGQKVSDVTVAADGGTVTLTYDPPSGNLTLSVAKSASGVVTTKNYTNGVLMRTVVQNTDGTTDYYNYNITGQTYTSQHQKLNAAGTAILTERFHTDGTLDYRQTIAADGTKQTVTYNSAGRKVSDVTIGADNSTTTLTYDPASGNLTLSVAKSASGVITTQNYTGGVLMRTVVQNTDGTTDYYNYNITGQTYTSQHQKLNSAGTAILTERFHTDGTLDYRQTIATDGTKQTVTYNSAGQKVSDITIGPSGTTTLTYDPASGNLVTSVAQGADGTITTKNYTGGVLMRTVVQNTDGTSDYYNYNITGQNYTTQHQKLDSSGKVLIIERYHADGTRESTQIYNSNGSKETVTYNSAGQKVSDVTVAANGATTTLTYDLASGNLVQSVAQDSTGTTTKSYTGGVLMRTVVQNADGTTDYYNYNVTGQTYATQHQKVNGSGVTVLTERFHADGTLDYTQNVSADGSKQTVTYDSAGRKVSDVSIAASGATTTLTYDPASGNLTTSVVQTADGVITTQNYTGGVLMRTVVQNADGSSDYYNYNITGQSYTTQHQKLDASGKVVLIERYHADNTRDSTQIYNSDGSKETITYNSAGQKVSDVTVGTDGSTTTLTYDPASGNLTQSVILDGTGTTTSNYTGGVLTRTVEQHPDGTTEYFNYNITGQTYTSQHQVLNAAGLTVLTERFHADGTRDYVQTVATDGAKDTITYNAAGQKVSDVSITAAGATTTLTYDPASGNLTQSVAQDTNGTVTKNYTAGVLMRTVEQHTDGTSDYYNYNITGQTYTTQHQKLAANGGIIEIDRYHADGTRDYAELRYSDGSKETWSYDGTGTLVNHTAFHVDGSRSVDVYVQDGSGDIRHETYDANLNILVRDYEHTDGTHTIYSYANDQVLDGGTHNDTFYFRTTTGGTLNYEGGNDTVLNFDTSSGHIKIDSALAHSVSDLQIAQTGSDVTITIDANDTIVLKQTTLTNIHDSIFTFV